MLFVATVIFTIGDGTMHVLIAPHLAQQGVGTTAIGPLIAGYSGVALVFRFVAGAIFPHRTRCMLPWLVFLGGFTVAAVPISPDLGFQALSGSSWGSPAVSCGFRPLPWRPRLQRRTGAEQRRASTSQLSTSAASSARSWGASVSASSARPTFAAAGLLFPVLYLLFRAQVLRRHRRGASRGCWPVGIALTPQLRELYRLLYGMTFF